MRPAVRSVWLAVAGLAIAATAGDLRAAAPSASKPEGAAPFHYEAKGRRDPFVPLVRDGHIVSTSGGVRGDSSKPVLYGVLWDPGGNSIALISQRERADPALLKGEVGLSAADVGMDDGEVVSLQRVHATSPSCLGNPRLFRGKRGPDENIMAVKGACGEGKKSAGLFRERGRDTLDYHGH